MKAIKKRIVGNKNFREVMLALTVSYLFFILFPSLPEQPQIFYVFVHLKLSTSIKQFFPKLPE